MQNLTKKYKRTIVLILPFFRYPSRPLFQLPMDKLDLYKLVFSLVGNQYWESLLMFQLVQSYISELKDDVRLIHNFVFPHDFYLLRKIHALTLFIAHLVCCCLACHFIFSHVFANVSRLTNRFIMVSAFSYNFHFGFFFRTQIALTFGFLVANADYFRCTHIFIIHPENKIHRISIHSMMAQCLKILGKVSSSIASEANLVLSRQKMVENAKKKFQMRHFG